MSKRPPTRSAQPTATQQIAACPRCRCTEHKVVRPLPTQTYGGVHQGQPFTSIERRRVRCAHCGQMFIRVERVFDPAAWTGNAPPSTESADAQTPGVRAR